MVRKNAIPVWIDYVGDICCICGQKLQDGTQIINAKYCASCSQKREKEMQLKKEEIIWMEYRSVCVKCGTKFQTADKVLFGIYCKNCGKKWEKERTLTQPKLKKARGIPEAQMIAKENTGSNLTESSLDEAENQKLPQKQDSRLNQKDDTLNLIKRNEKTEESKTSISKKNPKTLQSRLF